jgi:fructose-1,6-bisphosphatase/inositol monophosphatase family enzyme
MKVKASGFIAAMLLAVAPLVSGAAELPAAFDATSTLQAEGVVKTINQAQRSLTVLDAQGHEASFNITDARDLTKLSEGGKVHLRMVRNAVVRVTQAASGQSPAAQPDTIERVSAEVQAVDHASGVMALKRANGTVFHLQGREPANVAGVSVGMQVSVVFAPKASVAVAPAP